MAKTKSQLNPQQIEFLANYLNPHSDTFGNAYQSALKAGYAEEYAKNMVSQMPDWIADNINKYQRMLMKAEKVLETTLDDTDDKKLAQDTAKFISSRLGKKNWSEKTETEHTGEIKIQWGEDNPDTLQPLSSPEEGSSEPSEV